MEPGVVSRHEMFDAEQHQAELDRVFGTSWLFVGHESEIPQPGNWVTRTLAGDSVIMVRSPSGDVRVLLNSCSHRGTQLCRADLGTGSRFRCMYHGWTFDTEGELRGVPGLRTWYPPDFDRRAHGLRRARVASHAEMIFATWDDTAPELTDYLGEFTFYLDALLSRPSSGWEVAGEPLRWISRTNWKLSVENFGMDSLHLGTLHEGAGKLGIFGTTAEVPTAYTAVCEGGHGIEATKLPGAALNFPGYPAELWPQFRENLSPAQAWFAADNLVCKGNVFPNLSFIDLYHDYTGDPAAPPVAATMLRLVQPLAANAAEVWMWILVPRDAPEEWKGWSQESLVRTLGVSGTFEPDDLENTASISVANAGRTARELDLLMVAGAHLPATSEVEGHHLPGAVYTCTNNTESMQRGFFAELRRRLSEAPVPMTAAQP